MTPPVALSFRRPLAAFLAAFLLSAIGCDSARAPSASTSSSTSPSAAAPASSAQAEKPRAVELPEGVCRIAAKGFRGEGLTLRFTPGGRAFAIVGQKRAGGMAGLFGSAGDGRSGEVVLLDGPAKSFGVRIENPLLVLRGFTDVADLDLHPARASVIAGFLVPTRLRVVSASSAGVEVAPEIDKKVELVGSLPAQRATCAELSLDPAAADVDAALPAATKKDTYMLLREGDPIDLAVEPAGTAVARLRPSSSSSSVRVLDTKGKSTRIAWSLDGGTVFGWISSSALEKPPEGRRPGAEGRMRALPPEEKPVESLVCSQDVPLVAEVAGERVAVGHVRAGTVLGVMERAAPFARIAAPRGPDHGFGAPPPETTAAEGASFRVPASALDGCKPRPSRAPTTLP
ncbi:hypothetical protein [Polyangium jinanense]|uniref:SH3 domain-containing protein n=1 Tax=Polyangium jinanense TaxID=2829994 RepID=A0A9X3X7A7_9BACT|nr:hypothetical protein [Polyangium jinanense]MDC3962786.1 hypothetical protein [Polyangium jinanense]MDC3983895.1 hypothetical protein [Polyangium jinanense]